MDKLIGIYQTKNNEIDILLLFSALKRSILQSNKTIALLCLNEILNNDISVLKLLCFLIEIFVGFCIEGNLSVLELINNMYFSKSFKLEKHKKYIFLVVSLMSEMIKSKYLLYLKYNEYINNESFMPNFDFNLELKTILNNKIDISYYILNESLKKHDFFFVWNQIKLRFKEDILFDKFKTINFLLNKKGKDNTVLKYLFVRLCIGNFNKNYFPIQLENLPDEMNNPKITNYTLFWNWKNENYNSNILNDLEYYLEISNKITNCKDTLSMELFCIETKKALLNLSNNTFKKPNVFDSNMFINPKNIEIFK